MLKKISLFVLSISLLVWMQTVVAGQEIVSIELLKEKYGAGETVQAEITTELLEKPLKPEQLSLYVNGVKKSIAPFFTRYDERTYLLYFDLPIVLEQPTYLKVEKALYRGSAGLQEYTGEKEIPIINEPTSILSIIPGFIILEKNQKDVQIQVENKKGDSVLNISSSPSITHLYTTPQPINFNGKRVFKFSVDQEKLEPDAAILIEHSGEQYKVKVKKRQEIITQQPPQNQSPQIEGKGLVFVASKPEVEKTINADVVLSGILSVKNEGNITLENITLQLTGNLPEIASVDTTFISLLQPGQTLDILLMVNEDQNARPGTFTGVLRAVTDTSQATFPISVTIEKKRENQQVNRTKIDLELNTENRENPVEENNEMELNFSKQVPPTTEREYPVGLIIVTIFLVLIGVGFYILKKKKPAQEETFDDYIKKIRK